jgi:hypothetical protein
MRSEQEEKVERAEMEEVSKKKATNDMVSRWSDRAKGAPRMSIVGGSNAPKPPAPSLNFRCLSFVLYMCN